MEHGDLADFKNRIGFASLAGVSPTDGVRANWDELPSVLSGIVKGKRAYADQTNNSQSGVGQKGVVWRLKQGTLSVKVVVCGAGPAGAQQAFLEKASATMMTRIPYERTPQPLGDLAVYSPRVPAGHLLWVYRNVAVEVGNDGTTLAVEPAAHAIQKFMAAHTVARLADHLPVVEQVKVSSQEIHVGEEFQVTIRLGKQTRLDSVVTDFAEVLDPKTLEDKLELVTRTALSATFRAEKPGRTQVDVPVMDRKTLLSPPLSVTIDVLPAR
jgi:hypothetical protein